MHSTRRRKITQGKAKTRKATVNAPTATSGTTDTWLLSNALAANRKREELLKQRMQRHPREAWLTWGRVRPAAEALLAFAYEPLARLSAGARARRGRVTRQLSDFMSYEVRGWSLSQPQEPYPISDRQLRFVQGEMRAALVWLVLLPDENDRGRMLCWKQPTASVSSTFSRDALDGVVVEARVEPPQRQPVIRGAEVLADALPWLRCCELCGRLFFKKKRQRVCGPRCRFVFQSRQRAPGLRKGDQTERRGRPRTDYAAPNEAEHAAWIRAAGDRACRVGDGAVEPSPAVDWTNYVTVELPEGSALGLQEGDDDGGTEDTPRVPDSLVRRRRPEAKEDHQGDQERGNRSARAGDSRGGRSRGKPA